MCAVRQNNISLSGSVEIKKCMGELLSDGFVSKGDIATGCSKQPMLMVLIKSLVLDTSRDLVRGV